MLLTQQAPPGTGVCNGVAPCGGGEMALLVDPIVPMPEPGTGMLVGLGLLMAGGGARLRERSGRRSR